MNSPAVAEQNKNFNVRVLTEGGYVLSCGEDEYGYETKEQLLQGLSDELDEDGGDKQENTDMADKKMKVKKIMEDTNENE